MPMGQFRAKIPLTSGPHKFSKMNYEILVVLTIAINSEYY